jgi:hypothetical protein
MLIRQLRIQGSSHHPPHLMPELLNLGERRVQRRTLWTEPTRGHRGHAILQLLPRLVRQYDSTLSVHAHAIFLPK